MTCQEWLDKWLARAPILTEDQVDETLELIEVTKAKTGASSTAATLTG